ncbi:MAG: RNHCP domain-containing protein [Patescibacteria group bacterium]
MQQKINFKCVHCGKNVSVGAIGTKNRNHCPYCLYSKHVDRDVSGDRRETCHGLMKPVSLTFKEEGIDKYGKKKQGEIILIHLCEKCGDISINRIAGDDDNDMILEVFNNSIKKPVEITGSSINLLSQKDEKEIIAQLFGKKN